MSRVLKYLLALVLFLLLFLPLSIIAFAGNPPDPANSSLLPTSTGSNEVPADGSTQASVTVTLQDSFGTPLAGDTVSLAAPSDSTIVFSPTSASLDANGNATFSATSTTAGTDDIDVSDDTTVTTLSALGQIIFDAVSTPTPTPGSSSNSNSSSCSSTYPTDAPDLYQVSMSSGSADLYFVEPQLSQFDGYTISYGLTSNADTYNVSFSQGRVGSASKYTINSLSLNTKYYFKVRANNGCATGPWSQTLSSNTNSSGATLPATGPTGLLTTLGFIGMSMFFIGLALFKFTYSSKDKIS